MSKYGLEKKLTFDKVVDSGQTYDFTDVHVYNRAALNFRQGFFSQPPIDPDVVDNDHDDKHEAILAKMRAAAAEMERQAQRNVQQARQVFRDEAMPQHHAAHETPAPAPPPPPPPPPDTPAPPAPRGPMLSGPLTFEQKMNDRREAFKGNLYPQYTRDVHRARQGARQAVERNADLQARRRRPQEFHIASSSSDSSPPPSPRGPSTAMQNKYDKRLLKATTSRNPQVKKTRPSEPKTNDRLTQARASAEQIANKRPLPTDRSTLRKRKKLEGGDRGRQRNN